jgi:predicted RNA-binding Zn-ribbon protein involved in translation (DUF1610 family)
MTNSEDNSHYSLSISVDNDYLRQTCPSCGLDFKLTVNLNDLLHFSELVFKEYDPDLEFNNQEEEFETIYYCPYCKFKSESTEIQTEETIRYVKNLAFREIVYPQIKALTDSMKNLTMKSTFLEIKVEQQQFSKPPLPISGPAIPDMRIVQMLCCEESIKILGDWQGHIYCPICGKETILV